MLGKEGLGMPVWLSLCIAIISLITSIIGLVVIFSKIVTWVNKKDQLEQEVADIRLEQSIITVGVLACLKSLVDDCDDRKNDKELRDAITLVETHLNQKAHGL